MNWEPVGQIPSRSYECGFCGNRIASIKGWYATVAKSGVARPAGNVYICPHCTNPTYFTGEGRQIPGTPFGAVVSGIDEKGIEELYNEARRAYSGPCYTAVVLCCRKLLMHLAVSKGAQEGLPFAKYVDFLDSNHFVPPGARRWVDRIREKGNEANHEIVLMTKPEAEEMILFSEMLLRILYEFPAKVK
jgi:hypothetical protein